MVSARRSRGRPSLHRGGVWSWLAACASPARLARTPVPGAGAAERAGADFVLGSGIPASPGTCFGMVAAKSAFAPGMALSPAPPTPNLECQAPGFCEPAWVPAWCCHPASPSNMCSDGCSEYETGATSPLWPFGGFLEI